MCQILGSFESIWLRGPYMGLTDISSSHCSSFLVRPLLWTNIRKVRYQDALTGSRPTCRSWALHLFVPGPLKPGGPARWFLRLGETPVSSYTQGTGLLLHPFTRGTCLPRCTISSLLGSMMGLFWLLSNEWVLTSEVCKKPAHPIP